MSLRQNQDLAYRDVSTAKPGTLGTYQETVDGRGFRLGLAGAVDLAPGKVTVAETVDSDATNKSPELDVAVGATKLSFVAGGAVTANRYVDGYLNVNAGAGLGIDYLVKGNTGVSGATSLQVRLAEPIKVALTAASSKVSLTANPYSGVVISVVDQLDLPTGVPNVTIPAANYGWIQTHGTCAVLADETLPLGSSVVIGSGTAGAVEEQDTDETKMSIGAVLVAGVDTEYRDIFLTIN